MARFRRRKLPLLPVFLAFFGAALGGWCADLLQPPAQLDAGSWSLLVPNMDPNDWVKLQRRGVYVTSMGLEILPHPFRAASQVVPNLSSISKVSVELAPRSGPLNMIFHDKRGRNLERLVLEGKSITTRQGNLKVASPAVIFVQNETLYVQSETGPVSVIPMQLDRVDFSALDTPVRIRSIQLDDTQGKPALSKNFVQFPALPILLGATYGLLMGLIGIGSPRSLIWLLLPILSLLPGLPGWFYLTERLYLPGIPWHYALLTALALHFPFLVAQCSSRQLFQLPTEARPLSAHFLLLGVVVALAASAGLANGVMAGFLLLLWAGLVWKAKLDAPRLLLYDAPALALLCWPDGLLLALLWRVLIAVALLKPLAEAKQATSAVNFLAVHLLLFLPGLELALRDSTLSEAWDIQKLAGESDTSWRKPEPFYEASCGKSTTLSWVGGSSTGGAYQFRNKRDAFAAGQVHQLLCADGAAITTRNFGESGRDTFTISRTIDQILGEEQRPLLIFYGGVNDLLTFTSTRSRAEREAAENELLAKTSWIAAHSRLITGLGLVLRPPVQVGVQQSSLVPEVPLPDARENLKRMITAVKERNGQVLLMGEYMASPELLQSYLELEKELAATYPMVTYLDTYAALGPYSGEGLLADQNHLTEKGCRRLAEAMLPVLKSLLEQLQGG